MSGEAVADCGGKPTKVPSPAAGDYVISETGSRLVLEIPGGCHMEFNVAGAVATLALSSDGCLPEHAGKFEGSLSKVGDVLRYRLMWSLGECLTTRTAQLRRIQH